MPQKINKKIALAVVLNMGDGLTTGLSYLLPMVLFGGHFQARSLLIGGTGGAVSMALNLDNAENGEGSPLETAVAFLSAFCGGILPVLPFLLFRGLFAGLLCSIIVTVFVGIILSVKSQLVGSKRAVKQTLFSLLPAIIIVCLLSLLV